MSQQLFDLTGRVALVTGGNRGIGFAMAEAMGRHGADIVIWGSNTLRNEQALSQLTDLPGRVFAQTVDVSSEAAIETAMARLLEEMGRLDTCVANAGIGSPRKPITEATTEEMRKVIGVNMEGAFWTMRAACRHMVDRAKSGDPGGSLIAVTSTGGMFGQPNHEPYAMTKQALGGLMRSLASGYGRYGIRANCVAPGFIATELMPDINGEKPTTKILPRIPARRWGNQSDFAGIAVYLASDASVYHSGDTFVIDGGFSVF